MAFPLIVFGGRRVWGATVKSPLPPVDLSFIESRIKLLRRSKWTDALPKTWILREAGHYDRLTLHHAGNSTNFNTAKNAVIHDLNGILAGHIERNYGDIGYHFIIDYAGRIWEGRLIAYEGAHVSGQNERNIAVMLLGNFEKQRPSLKQLSAMRQIVPLLCGHYGIKRHRIYGHRDLGPSVCPGKNLYPYVVKLKS